MAKRSQFFVFGDQSWPAESFAQALPADWPVTTWIEGRGWVGARSPSGVRATLSTAKAWTAAEACVLPEANKADAVAIVGFRDSDVSQRVVECLRARQSDIKILEVGAKGSRVSYRSTTKRSVAWRDIVSEGMEQELGFLSVQKRVKELRDCLEDAPQIALLLQDDPDPDGLASALAVRKLLGRNAQTAPIVSFGRISRPENVSMARLLGIEVETIPEPQLGQYGRVVLIDCQPSFFKGRRLHADVVLDHHPRAPYPENMGRTPKFEEICEDFGALSSMLTRYLRAAGVEVSQRLATALLYGIKSDTFLLNREVVGADIEAFMFLYPLVNTNMLRRIERPELPLGYLESLRKGLARLVVEDGIVVLDLGPVEREEWIPQAADFSLQVEGAHWAFGCGRVDKKIVISGRNCGYVQHCGDLFKELFDKVGCAGGHRTMAKAIVPIAAWEKKFGGGSASPLNLSRMLADLVASKVATAGSA